MTTEQVDPRRRLCLVLRLSQGIKLVRSLSQVKLQAEEPQRVSKQIILSKSLFPLLTMTGSIELQHILSR